MKAAVRIVVPVLLLVAAVAWAASQRAQVGALPDKWRRWLEQEVYPLITSEQRKAFLALETEAQREEFVERLWQLWGEQSGRGAIFRRTWEERLEMARSEFESTTEDRARVLLLHGPPDVRKPIDCTEVFQPLEFWRYAYIEGLGQAVTILFYRPYGLGQYRLWQPFETRAVLYSPGGQMAIAKPIATQFDRPEWRCGDANEILGLLSAAEFWLRDAKTQSFMSHVEAPVGANAESGSARFLQFSTLVPEGAAPVEFTLTTVEAGRRGAKVRVAFRAAVASEGLKVTKIGDVDVIQLDVVGEISQEGTMVDRFRYAFTFPAGTKELPVAVERDLRPGSYSVRMKVQDGGSSRAAVKDLGFQVTQPVVEPPTAAELAGAAAVAKVAEGPGAALALNGPQGEGVFGVQRFAALVGADVTRVEFFLDNRPVLTKNRPPFEVELDLGPIPRLASVTAVAYDRAGNEIDRKQLDVNVGRERFLVRLQPVGSADRAQNRVRALCTVNVPSDRKLEKVEVYWNELLAATLFEPPFETWMTVDDPTAVGYMRARAVLDDGAQAEDVQFVNAPQFLGDVRVEAVELPVTVLDRAGKPIDDLKAEEFEVLEEGVAQRVSHFARQQDLPIRVGLVIDTSGSMANTLGEVQRVVMGFLRDMLRPADRAFVVAFSERPALIEGFTANFSALERALISLKADRETALYDAVVYGLFQYSGVRGRRAMIVLTDGEDNASRMDFERTVEYARRSGVTIYTIGVDLPITKVEPRSQMRRLARMTGGEVFFLARDAGLKKVYDQIDRELRTQYVLAYTSNAETVSDAFRKVTVNVKRPGVEVRTIAGYYPGE
jgi:VWFA-related protein